MKQYIFSTLPSGQLLTLTEDELTGIKPLDGAPGIYQVNYKLASIGEQAAYFNNYLKVDNGTISKVDIDQHMKVLLGWQPKTGIKALTIRLDLSLNFNIEAPQFAFTSQAAQQQDNDLYMLVQEVRGILGIVDYEFQHPDERYAAINAYRLSVIQKLLTTQASPGTLLSLLLESILKSSGEEMDIIARPQGCSIGEEVEELSQLIDWDSTDLNLVISQLEDKGSSTWGGETFTEVLLSEI